MHHDPDKSGQPESQAKSVADLSSGAFDSVKPVSKDNYSSFCNKELRGNSDMRKYVYYV